MSSTRPARRLAHALLLLAAVEVVVAIVAAVAQRMAIGEAVDTYLVTNMAMGAGFAACGGILAIQRSANPVGWLLLAAGLAHLTTAVTGTVGAWGAGYGWSDVSLRMLATIGNAAWPWGICMFLALALQVFPTGRPVSPRWRWLPVVTVGCGVLFAASMATDPAATVSAGRSFTSYLALPFYHSWEPLWTVGNAAPMVGLVGAVAGLVVRYRRGDDQLRRQLLWLVLALVLMIAVNLPRWIVGDGPILLLLAVPLVPIAITIAILRHQLLDITLVVSRAALYLTLTVCVVGAYTGLLALANGVRVGSGAPVVVTLAIALAFNPVRGWLQRQVERLLYGSRSDPVAAVTQVGARMAADDLTGVLHGIRAALRLPYAALRHDGVDIAASGEPTELAHPTPLAFAGQQVGELVVGVRRGEHALGGGDISVLGLLAAPLATALSATALAAEVQVSRGKLVTAREEERLRLHRELHDGLGPALTGAAFKADAAYNVIATAPERAEMILSELRVDIRAAIDDVRRLVYGLRPPALDELGLVGALRRYCQALPFAVTFDAPEHLRPLPAAVEVAAYRIGTEALTNVTRHARATAVRITVSVDHDCQISIDDDGNGDAHPGRPWPAGVGLTSIRDRAAELGGTCVAGPTETGGRVFAVIPLPVLA